MTRHGEHSAANDVSSLASLLNYKSSTKACYSCQRVVCSTRGSIKVERRVLMSEQIFFLHWPARLRKKIEWVSLMLKLSSRTNVLPSARAQCNMDDNERNKRTLQSKIPIFLWVVIPARLLDDELDRFVCMTDTSDAILLQKSTSALAFDFTLTPRSSQSQRGTRLTCCRCANRTKALL